MDLRKSSLEPHLLESEVVEEDRTMAGPEFGTSMWRVLTGPGMLGGPFQFRLILQPLAAIVLGVRLGIRDAKAGRPPFLLALLHDKGKRGNLLGEAVRDAVIPLALAFIVDSILQHMIAGRVRPLAAVVVGGLLVFLPFLVVRALSHRLWTHRHAGGGRPARQPR